jgi:hypothetical protein
MACSSPAELASHPGRKVNGKEVQMAATILTITLLVAILVIDRLAR